jgi:hypothetical protein
MQFYDRLWFNAMCNTVINVFFFHFIYDITIFNGHLSFENNVNNSHNLDCIQSVP